MKQYIYIKSWNGFLPRKFFKERDLGNYYKEYYHSKSKNKHKNSEFWIKRKKSIAKDLIKIISKYNKVLSIGCGEGDVEKFIVEKIRKKNFFLHGIDPFIDKKSELNSENLKIECCSVFDKKLKSFDISFINTVDYCLSDVEYIEMFKSLSKITKHGILLSQLMPPDPEYLSSLKNKIITFYKSLPLTPYVFWGYQRTIDEHIRLLKNCGFVSFKFGYHSIDATWMWVHAK